MAVVTELEIEGDWNITKGKPKQKWAKHTDGDLQFSEGKQDEYYLLAIGHQSTGMLPLRSDEE